MSTSTTDRPGTTDGRARRSISLGEAFTEFTRWPSPRIIAALLATAVVARSMTAGWTVVDLWLAVGMLVAQPFVEWTAHVLLLHMKPVAVGRFTFDPLFARKHREHHADPRIMELTFLPTVVVVQLAVVVVLAALFAFPRVSLGLTFLVTIGFIGIVYELSLIHI